MVYKPAIKNNYAFTLVELLIAVSVMLVLTAVTVMLLNPTKLRSDANETKSLSELGTVTNALEFYYSDKKSYPADLNGASGLGLISGNYISDVGLLTDDAGTSYCYLTKGTPVNSYKICTKSTKATVTLTRDVADNGYDGVTNCSSASTAYPAGQKVQCLQSPF